MRNLNLLLPLMILKSYSDCSTSCGLDLASEYGLDLNAKGNTKYLYTNGIPSHPYHGDDSPNQVCQEYRYQVIPDVPALSNNYKTSSLGPVGILLSGGFLYNHLDGPENAKDNVAVTNRGLDQCFGHSDPTCRYHYHKNPVNCIPGYAECALIGWMGDGFPVYGYCTHNNVKLQSCYKLKAGANGQSTTDYEYDQTGFDNGTCHLDKANGYKFLVADGKGIEYTGTGSDTYRYGYVMSEAYPWVMPGSYGEFVGPNCFDHTCTNGDYSYDKVTSCHMNCPTPDEWLRVLARIYPFIIAGVLLVCLLACCCCYYCRKKSSAKSKSSSEDEVRVEE